MLMDVCSKFCSSTVFCIAYSESIWHFCGFISSLLNIPFATGFCLCSFQFKRYLEVFICRLQPVPLSGHVHLTNWIRKSVGIWFLCWRYCWFIVFIWIKKYMNWKWGGCAGVVIGYDQKSLGLCMYRFESCGRCCFGCKLFLGIG